MSHSLQARADYAPYYRHALLYLACVNTETDMSPEERLNRAHDLGISALLGATIYNFGELVSVHCGYIYKTDLGLADTSYPGRSRQHTACLD